MFSQFKKNLKKQEQSISEDTILAEQFDLINGFLEIINKQKAEIDYKAENSAYYNEVDALKWAELLNTKSRYLDFFYKIAEFLLRKLKTETKEDLHLLAPNVRTLFDIYAKILYLANKSSDEQMLNCIYERLNFLKKYENKEEFEKNYLAYKPFLDANSFIVDDYDIFSKNRSKEYLFPKVEQIFQKYFLDKFKPRSLNKEHKSEDVYGLYRSFSEYTHGNMLSKDAFGNEDYWIIRNIIYLSSLITIAIDGDVLENKNNGRIEYWNRLITERQNRFNLFYVKFRYKKGTGTI